MYSNYKPSSSIPNTNNRWGQQPQPATVNVNNTDLSNILSFVGGVQAQQVHQQPSENDNLKQTSNPNYVHPDAQHADAVLRAKAIAAHMKARQIAAGFQGHPPVVHHDSMMKASTSYSSLMADNNTPAIGNNNTDSNTTAMNTAANSWSLPDSLPPTLNTLDNRYKAPPSSQPLLPPTQGAATLPSTMATQRMSNEDWQAIHKQQQQHIDELRMLNMDGSKQPILPPTSQKLGKFHPLKEEDSDEASLFSDTDNEHKRRDEHLEELHKLNMDGSPNSAKTILKKLPQDGDEKKEEEEIVESDDESLFGSSSSSDNDEDEVFGQESSHVQHEVMGKLQGVDLPLKSGDDKATTKEAPSRRGKDVASLQRRGVTQPSSEATKKIPIFNPPTLKGGESEDDDASSDDGSGSSKKSGGLLGGLLSKVGSKDKAQNKLYRENTKKIKYRDTTVKDLTPDNSNRSSEKEKKLQKFLLKQRETDAMSGKTIVELYSTPSSSTTKAVPNTDTAPTSTKKKKPTTTNNDWQYSSQETKWNKNYNIIQQYISKHGNTNIPEGHSLHKWVQSQRNICLRWIAGVNKNEELIGSHLQRYVHVYKLHSINFDWGNTVDRRVLHDVLAVVDMNLSPVQRETLFPKKTKTKLPKQNVSLKKRKLVKSGSVFDSISSKRKQERDDTRHQGKRLARNVTDHNSSDEGGGSAKKRPRDEDIIDFTDDIDSESISWNDHTKKPKKRRKAAFNNMPANQWVNLIIKSKERHSSKRVTPPSSESKTSSSNKCWSNLVKAGDEEESIDLSALVRSKIVEEQLQNSIKEAAAKASSEEMMTISELKKSKEVFKEAAKATSPEKSIISASKEPLRVLKNGKKIYAAFWKTSARSGRPTFYPGVVASSKVVVKGGESTVLYNIDYDDGDKGKDIDGKLVKTRKTYLRKNLKPFLAAGDKVYAVWWEDEKRDKAATWHPGVVKSVVEFSHGGEYGPIRKYDVAFDDGDELDSIEDYFVMDKKDYLISVRKEDGEWMGVENRLEKSSIDNWEKYAGLWVSTIDGEEQLFGQLSDALRAYDKYTVRRKGVKTKEKNLNLPEEWAFPTPFGICPPVHIGGNDDDSTCYSSPEAGSKKNRRKREDPEVIDLVEPSTTETKSASPSSADATLETKECGDCNKAKPKRKFSEREWAKEDDGNRQCEKCVKLDMLLAKHREQNVLPTTKEQVATTKAQAAAKEEDSHPVLGHSRSSTKAILNLMDSTGTDKSEAAAPPAKAKAVHKSKPQAKRSSSSKLAPPLTNKESKISVLPASEFGEGWKVRKVPRSNGTHTDSYYYSPIMGYKFRSKAEVGRFLEHLEEANGDESIAIDMYKGSKKKGPSKKRQASSSQQSNVPPKKARRPSVTIAYIEPSQSSGSSEDSMDKGETIKTVTKSSSDESTTQYIKPTIKKGEKIYAVWSGPDGKGEVWYPGRTWDSKEEPSREGYGPIRKYDIVFDDGDMEPDVDEIWVSKKSEYEVSIAKPEDTWIGVTNVRFEYSNDDYARLIGWYKTTVGDVTRVYTSLRSALRAYDKFIIESKGKDKVSAKELNFPEEHL